MSQNAARLFNTRNMMGVVLIAGIAAGVYLGDFMKGPGWGGSSKGPGNSTSTSTGKDGTADKKPVTDKTEVAPEKIAALPQTPVVKVVIADRSYFLRSAEGDQPIELDQVVAQATAAKGDVDGIRIRVYRKLSSRTAAEIALRDALAAAGVGDDQTVWVPNPVDD
ncbi:MAG: hypothetical protein JWP89_1251 [Schlesneria sp.]|nr:hypothetical protein [Schlesneria sp.]